MRCNSGVQVPNLWTFWCSTPAPSRHRQPADTIFLGTSSPQQRVYNACIVPSCSAARPNGRGKKARPSRVLTSPGGATVSGAEDVRVRLIGGLSAPGNDDLETAAPHTGDSQGLPPFSSPVASEAHVGLIVNRPSVSGWPQCGAGWHPARRLPIGANVRSLNCNTTCMWIAGGLAVLVLFSLLLSMISTPPTIGR